MNSQKTSFTVITYTIKELFENMKYIEIPLYQRSYKWDREQVIPLIEDIIARSNDDNEHYFGVIAKSKSDFTDGKKEVVRNRIIDGQQRITTSIILIHYLIANKYEYDENSGVKGGFKSEFNEVQFSNEIKTAESESVSSISSSDPKYVTMSGRVKAVYGIIDDYFKTSNVPVDSKYFGDLLETFLNKFKIASLNYEISKSEETLVFENLNSKGTPLAEFDLIRNSIISLDQFGGENQAKLFLQQFNANVMQMMYSGVFKRTDAKAEKTFEKFLETFLTWKMGELQSFKTYKLYRNFKIYVENEKINFEQLMKELKKFISLYLTVDSKEQGQIGAKLWFRVIDNKDVHYPYIFELFDKYGKYDSELNTWESTDLIISYTKALATHLIKLMSVNGTGQSFGGLIKELIKKIDDKVQPKAIKEYLAQGEVKNGNTPQDKDFILSCKREQTQRWIPESIIDIIENSVNDLNEGVNYNGRTLEHIMPQKPKYPAWPVNDVDFYQNHSAYLNQIGNLIFLNGKKNTSAGNKPFRDKNVDYYSKSISPLVTSKGMSSLKQLTSYNEWSFNDIDKRTTILAGIAAKLLK